MLKTKPTVFYTISKLLSYMVNKNRVDGKYSDKKKVSYFF